MVWKKFKGEYAWENKTPTKTTILKTIETQEGYYIVKDVDGKSGFETHPLNLSRKDTKADAIRFAKKWMKSHPNG